MKFNISYPERGTQKIIDIDDDKKCSVFFDERIGAEVPADNLGEEYKGYVFRINGGNDKQGFPMKQGIITKGRPKILMVKGHSCYRPRRTGERKRKTVRGCIVDADIRVLAVSVVKKGEKEIDGLTNDEKPRRLGPKRASKIRKYFQIKNDADNKEQAKVLIRKFAVRRTWDTAAGKKRTKAPKIQRIVTESRLRNKRIQKKEKQEQVLKTQKAGEEYKKFLEEWRARKASKKSADIARKKSSVDQPTQKVVTPAVTKQTPAQKTTTTAPVKTQPKQTPVTQPKKK